MLGDLISAGAKLLGGSMASDATKEANRLSIQQAEKAYDRAAHDKQLDRDLQIRFAQQGIQWRADDALRAGIHPLYALGANVPTYSGSPISVGTANITPDTSMGSAVASMGQDIGRAINSTRTQDQRDEAYLRTSQALSLQKMGLENDLLASQIKRLQANDNPPFPSANPLQNNPTTAASLPFPASWSVEEDKLEKRPQVIIGGRKWDTDPRTVGAQAVTNLVGDEGPAAMAINAIIGMQHLKHHLQANTTMKYSKPTSWRDWLPSFSFTK